MPRSYYDDNFGCWDINDQDDVEFYKRVQRESRPRKCQGCGRRVRLRPDYAICNDCCVKHELGGDH